MTSQKIAVVTGSNKGIGFAIVKGLCEKFKGIVYLTARDISRGEEAVAKLKALGLSPSFHQLDISDQASIEKFKNYIKGTHGGLDVLVNNAAIAFKGNATEPFGEQAEKTVGVNYFATLQLCNSLFPLLRPNAKVVNVSSSEGHPRKIPSESLRRKFTDPTLSLEHLNELMNKFMSDAKSGTAQQEGWGNSTYAVSKVGLSALSIIQQKLFDKEDPNRNISVNHVHPGYVDTDMTSHKGPLSIEEGAKSTLFAILDSDLKGAYIWSDCKVVPWTGENIAPPL